MLPKELNIKRHRLFSDNYLGLLLGTLGFGAIALFFLKDYFHYSLNLLMGLLLVPFVFSIKSKNYFSFKLLFSSLLFILLSTISPLKTFLFLSLIFSFLFFIEGSIGRQNILPPALLITLSPIFTYFSNLFGIPARIQLSELAANALYFIGYPAKALGNIIIIDHQEFSVDPACMGLSMITTSMLVGIFILAYYEKCYHSRISNAVIALLLFINILLNVISNLLRIIVLVLFNIPPQNISHDMVGLVCFIVYIILPFYFLCHLTYKFFSSPNTPTGESVNTPKAVYLISAILILIIAIRGSALEKDRSLSYQFNSIPEIEGYSSFKLESGVSKLEKEGILMYVKPLKNFYGTEHSPLVCWTGSGYEFKAIEKIKINGTTLYFGKLQKGQEVIFSSWWFNNGRIKTINPLTWRWELLKANKDFFLINVNATNKKDLLRETSNILKKKII